MSSTYQYMFIGFVSLAILVCLRYGYIAATEGTGPKKARALLIANCAFASLAIGGPLCRMGYESQLPVFEFTGVIESVHIENSSPRSFSAELSILTTAGGTINIHVSDRNRGWAVGQRLRVRYLGDKGELVEAKFFDTLDNEVGAARRTSPFFGGLSIVFGVFVALAAWLRYKRDPVSEFEGSDGGDGGRLFEFNQEDIAEEEQMQAHLVLHESRVRRRKWAMIATVAFLASCAAVWPFLEGNPLHRYWDTLGIFFLFISMILLIPFAVSLALGINALVFGRGSKRLSR
jgi:hypothetical protein